MLNHGINTYKDKTKFASTKTAAVGIPFFVGAWPCHQAGGYTGKPQIAYNMAEAQKLGGYSAEWRDDNGAPKWSLCQAAYAAFKLFAVGPAIFYNLFDPATHKKAATAADKNIVDGVIKLPGDAINDSGLVVKKGDTALVKGTDYTVDYDDDCCIVEIISDTYKSETKLNVAYNAVDLSNITAETVEAAIEKIELCKPLFGIVPDLICCPGWSQTPSVAAVMAAKAANINGIYKAKAVVDLDTSSAGADTYDDVLTYKTSKGYTDANMIVCWPLVEFGDYLFDLSVVLCCKMADIDSDNGDCPFESPSNKAISITACVDKTGKEIDMTVQHADAVSYNAGVVTVLNFGGWVLWGNYTGCWPASNDVAEYFICTSRMLDFICNTFVNSYWAYIDGPVTQVKIDAVVNSFNSWLASLAHDGKIYGGEISFVSGDNAADLINGHIRFDTTFASPVPAQRIDMHAEFDVDTLIAALGN